MHWTCCCGCHCVEAEGVGSPPDYRFQLGTLAARLVTGLTLTDVVTGDPFTVTTTGSFAGLNACVTKNTPPGFPGVVYDTTTWATIEVKWWWGTTASGPPDGTSTATFAVELRAAYGVITASVSLGYAGTSYPPSPAGDDYGVAIGFLATDDLPAGWCEDGFTIPGEAFTFVDDGLQTDQAFPAVTEGGGTFVLTPCCGDCCDD